MVIRVLFASALLGVTGALLGVTGQAADVDDTAPARVVLSLSPQPAGEATAYRLLPAAPELKEGNAAVVMLRMIWEQQSYMERIAPELPKLMELPYDDPKVQEFEFDHFLASLRRAAYIADADWNYPLDDVPMAMILLPDAQGLRQFLGRGLTVWTRKKIATGGHFAAIESMRVQLACVRHLTRTPLVVVQLVGASVTDMTLDNYELLMSQPGAPNLYWALAVLPELLNDYRDTLQWDAVMLERSLPSLHPRPPALTDTKAWQRIAVEFGEYLTMVPEPVDPDSTDGLLERVYPLARDFLIKEQEFQPATLEHIGPEAVVLRWALATNQILHDRTAAAYGLPSPLALKKLQEIETEIEKLMEMAGTRQSPYTTQRVEVYLALHRFNRRVKFLQAVEAIRDYAAGHGRLPQHLSEVSLHVPHDPMTALPFEYEYDTGDGSARLQMPLIPGVSEGKQKRRMYELVLR